MVQHWFSFAFDKGAPVVFFHFLSRVVNSLKKNDLEN